MSPDITERCCPQECVDCGMKEDIPIGMGFFAKLIRHGDPADHELPALYEAMKVPTLTDTDTLVFRTSDMVRRARIFH